MNMLAEIQKLLQKPTRMNWEVANKLVHLSKDFCGSSREAYVEAIECSAWLRTWYRSGCRAVGPAMMRRSYGPKETPYIRHRRKPARPPLRPSIRVPKEPLPGPKHPSYREFMNGLNRHETLRAMFAYAPRFKKTHPVGLATMISYNGGMLRAIPLVDMYRGDIIDRSAWRLGSSDWEHNLIEDLAVFQILHRPGIRTRSLLRMSLQLSGFVRERTRLTTELCLFAAMLDLRKAGRITELSPGRWRINRPWSEAALKLSEAWGERAVKAG